MTDYFDFSDDDDDDPNTCYECGKQLNGYFHLLCDECRKVEEAKHANQD